MMPHFGAEIKSSSAVVVVTLAAPAAAASERCSAGFMGALIGRTRKMDAPVIAGTRLKLVLVMYRCFSTFNFIGILDALVS